MNKAKLTDLLIVKTVLSCFIQKKKKKKFIQVMFSVFEWFVLILQCDTFVVIVLSDDRW